jgi:hypothetical protein
MIRFPTNFLGQRVQNINESIDKFLNDDSVDGEGTEGAEGDSESKKPNKKEDKDLVRKRIANLNALFNEVVELAKQREAKLNESYTYWLFSDDLNDEDLWLLEKTAQLQFVNPQTQPKNELEFRKLLYIPNIIKNEMDAHFNLQTKNLYTQGMLITI